MRIAETDATATPRPSQLGLGGVTFGREIDRVASFAMLDRAAELGWTHLDTAAAYGGGESERIIGEWLACSGSRKRMTIATKLLPPYSAQTIMAGANESRKRLRVDTLDVLYLHRWDATATEPDVLRAAAELIGSGHVRSLGVSNFDSTQLRQFLDLVHQHGFSWVSAVQNVNNVALRGIDSPTRALCAAHNVAIVTYSPLGAGFLTGKYATAVPAGSRFGVIPGHQDLYFTSTARARLAHLESVAARIGLPAADLALAWALHQPQIATVLVGGRTPAQLDRAVEAQKINLPEVFAELDAA